MISKPFLSMLSRFLFCRAVLTLYKPTFNKKEFLPECMPLLPDSLLPTSTICRTTVLQMAHIFGATDRFILSEEIILPENRHEDMEVVAPSWSTSTGEMDTIEKCKICEFKSVNFLFGWSENYVVLAHPTRWRTTVSFLIFLFWFFGCKVLISLVKRYFGFLKRIAATY